jgi:hypothetical protein
LKIKAQLSDSITICCDISEVKDISELSIYFKNQFEYDKQIKTKLINLKHMEQRWSIFRFYDLELYNHYQNRIYLNKDSFIVSDRLLNIYYGYEKNYNNSIITYEEMEKFYRVCKKYENKMEKIANKELKK